MLSVGDLFCKFFVVVFVAFNFCRFCVVIWFFFIPATTANDLRLPRIFDTRFYPLHLFSYLNSWERTSIFPFEGWVLNKGTTGTIFITPLVWRGPWLGIEPGTSRTRSQHYTTRLSRRRYYNVDTIDRTSSSCSSSSFLIATVSIVYLLCLLKGWYLG